MATGTDSKEAISGFFDPCPLPVLAENMRDGRWIDMRTEEGLVKRVRIEQIVVRPETEDVIVRQEWVAGGDDVKFRAQTLTIDAEAIWKVRPTNYHPEQIGPQQHVRPVGEPPDAIETVQIVAAAQECAVFIFRVGRDELLRYHTVEPSEVTNARHKLILVVYEMTNLSPLDICTQLGYKSQGPWMLATSKATARRDSYYYKQGFREDVKNLGKLVDDQLAPNRYRRTAYMPNDYTPVLL